MSASSTIGGGPASDALHQAVDGIGGSVADLTGEMGIDLGGARAGVAEVLLDQPGVETVLEQVSGVAVPQRVNVGTLADAALFEGAPEGFLQGGPIDGRRGRSGCRSSRGR